MVTPPLVRREAASQKPICWISSDIKVCKNEQKCRLEQRSLRRNLVQHRFLEKKLLLFHGDLVQKFFDPWSDGMA